MSMTAQEAKEIREWRKSHGICVRCWKDDAVSGKTLCLVCLMDRREYAREHYSRSEEERRILNEKKRLRTAEKKSRGECLQCSRPVYKNHAYCHEHYISQKRAHDRNRRKKYPYHPTGTCWICGAEPEPGFKMCPVHRKEYADRINLLNDQRRIQNEKRRTEQDS